MGIFSGVLVTLNVHCFTLSLTIWKLFYRSLYVWCFCCFCCAFAPYLTGFSSIMLICAAGTRGQLCNLFIQFVYVICLCTYIDFWLLFLNVWQYAAAEISHRAITVWKWELWHSVINIFNPWHLWWGMKCWWRIATALTSTNKVSRWRNSLERLQQWLCYLHKTWVRDPPMTTGFFFL